MTESHRRVIFLFDTKTALLYWINSQWHVFSLNVCIYCWSWTTCAQHICIVSKVLTVEEERLTVHTLVTLYTTGNSIGPQNTHTMVHDLCVRLHLSPNLTSLISPSAKQKKLTNKRQPKMQEGHITLWPRCSGKKWTGRLALVLDDSLIKPPSEDGEEEC